MKSDIGDHIANPNAQRPFFIMRTHGNHRAFKPRIPHARQGKEQLA